MNIRILLLLFFCKLLIAATTEEIVEEYQQQIDNFLLDLDYEAAIEVIEEFKSLYPEQTQFNELLVTLKEMLRARNQEREVVEIIEIPEEEEPSEEILFWEKPIFYNLSEPFYELSSNFSLRSSSNAQAISLLDYFSSLEMAFFPFVEEDNLGFALNYSGRQLLMHRQEPLLSFNTIEASLLLRFLLFSNKERGALSLRTFFNFGFLITPLSSSDTNLVFTVGTSLRGAPLYVLFNFQTFEKLYATIDLRFSFASESDNYSNLSILFAPLYRLQQFLIGPHYLFQLQSWNMQQLNSHNFGLRFEFYFDSERQRQQERSKNEP